MASARAAVGSVLVAGALFGTAGTAQALGPAGTTPLGVGILRLAVGAAALLVAAGLAGIPLRRLAGRWRTPAGVLAALGAGLYQVCFFAAVDGAGVALGTLVTVGSAPVFAGLLGALALGHRPSGAWLAATGACIAGLALSSADRLGGASAAGLVLALGAGLCIAAYNIGARHQFDRGATWLEVPAAAFALGTLALLPVLAVQPLGWVTTPAGAGLALYLGFATMAVANLALGRGLGRLAPGPATTLMLADPLVATVLGVAVLAEPLEPAAAAGMALVFAGLALQGLAAARDAGPAAELEAEPLPVL